MPTKPIEAPAVAQQLIQNGFRVVPLPYGKKGPRIRDWPTMEFSKGNFSANNGVGIKTGAGIVAIDIDCYSPETVESIVAEFQKRFGPTLRRTGLAPKTALLARCNMPKKVKVALRSSGCDPVDKTGIMRNAQVEVLTKGQQLVAFGIHPDTGKPYHWHGNDPWLQGAAFTAVLPEVSPAALNEFLDWIRSAFGVHEPTKHADAAIQDSVLSRLAGYIEPKVVPEGGRNDAVLKYVGHLRGKGTPESVVLPAALNFNTSKCQPPLDTAEVERIVATYAAQGHPDATDWPEPTALPPVLHPAPPFDYKMLPEVFVDFVRDTSERMGVPPDYLAVPLMLSSAAALGVGWVICPKEFDKGWKETAVLWGGIVARPGSKKSPCLQLAAKPLQRIEATLKAAYQAAKTEYRFAKQAAKTGDGTGLIGLIEPKPERAVVQDTTYQSLADICSTSPKGLMAHWDEVAGMIRAWNMKGQEAARGFFLSAWSGDQPYTLDRKESGMTYIERLFIVISGGVQPSVLGALVRDARQNGPANDGLIQRFQLMVYPDENAALTEVDRSADELAANRALGAVERLRSITPAEIGVEANVGTGGGILHFSPSAQYNFDTVRDKINKKVRDPDCDPLLASHYAKMPGAIAKLAMLLHLLDDGKGPVSELTMSKALSWAVYMKEHAKRLYSLSNLADREYASVLLAKITSGALRDGFTAYELKRNGWSGLKSDAEVDGPLASLVTMGWLRPQTTGSEAGRPTVRYLINPKARGA